MASPTVILYDIPSRLGKCNSPNTWKTRLLLNHKKIPYETKWLEYPDIAPYLQSLGITPHAEGTSYTAYTLPAVTVQRLEPDGPLHIMDSVPIARTLESLFPSPPLHVSDPMTAQAENFVMGLMRSLFPAYVPKIPRILNPVSEEYYERVRAKQLGASLSDIGKAKGEQAWSDTQNKFQEVKELFDQDPSGPFIRGQQVSYEDFVFVGWFAGLEQFNADVFQKVIGFDKSFSELYKACQEWRARDDY